MSACMRRLYSSDQWAPGFESAFLFAAGLAGGLFASGDFRPGTFSLSVRRGEPVEAGSESFIGLFGQLSMTAKILANVHDICIPSLNRDAAPHALKAYASGTD